MFSRMKLDFSLPSSLHRSILEELTAEASRDEEVIGLLLIGSVARGEAYPSSDLDLYLLLRDGCRKRFVAEDRYGILVERTYADFEGFRSKIEQDPMKAYAYLDGRILDDSTGKLRELVAVARRRFETYTVPAAERQGIAHWLKSVLVKLVAATEAGDELKAAYIASDNSWKILEGLWAINRKPIPPGGAVLFHLKDLRLQSPDAEWVRRLYLGTTSERIQTAIEAIRWLLPRLEAADEA